MAELDHKKFPINGAKYGLKEVWKSF